MWGSFLLLLTEGYLEILISAYLNILSSINYTSGDKVSKVISYIMLVVLFALIPAIFAYMLTRSESFL